VHFTWHTLWSGKIGLPFLGNFDVGTLDFDTFSFVRV
jgi:hypothetical protein